MTAPDTRLGEFQAKPVSPAEGDPGAYVTGIADGNLATPVRLRTYLIGVGVVFRLSKRRKARTDAKGKAAKGISFRLPLRTLARVMTPVGVGIAAYLGYLQFRSSPVPGEVMGTWSTNDGRYAGRNFWVNPVAVAFQNGATGSQFSVHPIRKVDSRQVGDTLFLSIDYEQDGAPITLSLGYRETPRPEIRLTNHPAIRWLKTGDAPALKQ